MGLEAWIIVLSALVVAGAGLKGWGWWVRSRALGKLTDVQRQQRGVTLRVMVRGTEVLPGMRSGRTHRSTGDVALTSRRFLLVSNRGVLVDVDQERGRTLTSARCPGPGKLVLEGRVPRPDGRHGAYRIEAIVNDAPGWASSLQPFVDPAEDGVQFGVTVPS
ncbi:MAG: hypothetical protein KTR31_35795 [Myxococcales bacterium]|nr:hypothetical protein [Myxococcales bacterium]